MPSRDPKIVKAYKDGVITKGQYDKLSEGLLLGIIKKKGKGGGTKKGETRKTARKAYEPKKGKGKGVKETRKKTGKEAHKRGRPKGGSKVEIVK
jgi:hypothetical protein